MYAVRSAAKPSTYLDDWKKWKIIIIHYHANAIAREQSINTHTVLARGPAHRYACEWHIFEVNLQYVRRLATVSSIVCILHIIIIFKWSWMACEQYFSFMLWPLGMLVLSFAPAVFFLIPAHCSISLTDPLLPSTLNNSVSIRSAIVRPS